ncbi:MAG: hypothetical protein SGPRY_012984 [Prymnesium sp.]
MEKRTFTLIANAATSVVNGQKEVEGRVVSNNRHCHGAFAVMLSAGTSSHDEIGASEISVYESAGMFTCLVPASNNTLGSLTIEVTDRQGLPAHIGRLQGIASVLDDPCEFLMSILFQR